MDVGDRVRIEKGKNVYEGILLPSETGKVVIKLDSGYNVGFEKRSVKIKVLEKREKRIGKFETKKVFFDPTKPEISLITTGGTIASRIDYTTGAVHSILKAEEILNVVPELSEIVRISRIITPFTKQSENMLPEDWVVLANTVGKELKKSEGVIITHGTDTLAYTSAALSFMLRELSKPVVLVGSQRSSDRPSSDAAMNLICASYVAISEIAEVGICMHGSMNDDFCFFLPGTKTRKMHASRRDAFRPINTLPFAKVWPNGKMKTLRDYNKRKKGETKIDSKMDPNVVLLKTYPGADPSIIEHFISKGVRGIVIEATGLGHVPTHSKNSWIPYVKRAVDSDTSVFITTQTLYGRTHRYVYSNLRKLVEVGAEFLEDMLPETAYVKLIWVLGHTKKAEKIKKMMLTNYAKEMSPRSDFTFLY